MIFEAVLPHIPHRVVLDENTPTAEVTWDEENEGFVVRINPLLKDIEAVYEHEIAHIVLSHFSRHKVECRDKECRGCIGKDPLSTDCEIHFIYPMIYEELVANGMKPVNYEYYGLPPLPPEYIQLPGGSGGWSCNGVDCDNMGDESRERIEKIINAVKKVVDNEMIKRNITKSWGIEERDVSELIEKEMIWKGIRKLIRLIEEWGEVETESATLYKRMWKDWKWRGVECDIDYTMKRAVFLIDVSGSMADSKAIFHVLNYTIKRLCRMGVEVYVIGFDYRVVYDEAVKEWKGVKVTWGGTNIKRAIDYALKKYPNSRYILVSDMYDVNSAVDYAFKKCDAILSNNPDYKKREKYIYLEV